MITRELIEKGLEIAKQELDPIDLSYAKKMFEIKCEKVN